MTTCRTSEIKNKTKTINALGLILYQDIVILGQLNFGKIVGDPFYYLVIECGKCVGALSRYDPCLQKKCKNSDILISTSNCSRK